MSNKIFSATALRDNARLGYFNTLTFLRACAVLLVMSFHLVPREWVAGVPILDVVVNHGNVGVELFFIISGFIVPYAMWQGGYTLRALPRFLAKRLIRLEPTYIVSIFYIVLLQWITFEVYGWDYSVDWKRIFVHFGYLNQYLGYESYMTVYWSLALELQFYILIALIFVALVTRYQVVSLIVITLFCMVTTFVFFPYNLAIFQYAVLFSIGIVLFMYAVGKLNVYFFAAAEIVLCGLLWYKGEPHLLLIAMPAILLMLFCNITWKPMLFIGTVSYSLYLFHQDTMGYFRLFLYPMVENKLIIDILAIPAAFAIGIGFYYLVERPSHRWAKKIKYYKTKKESPAPVGDGLSG